MSGYLANKTSLERKTWVEQKSDTLLTSCSESEFEKETNLFDLKQFLARRSQYDLFEVTKTIDVRLYFESLVNGYSTFLIPSMGWYVV